MLQMPAFQSLALLVVVVVVVSIYVEHANGGITSKFIRTEWPSTDIPLDNEAFAVPKGHNAPQQVSLDHIIIPVYMTFSSDGLTS